MPKVSILTPTFQREAFHTRIARCVANQTYEDIEWLVLDDSPAPSKILTERHARTVRYHHMETRQSVGMKRNWLAEKATGDIIVHFDDDDYYSPEYVETLVRKMEHEKWDLLNLRGWFILDMRANFFGYWNLLEKSGLHYVCDLKGVTLAKLDNPESFATIELGWGFGYAYRKKVWQEIGFPDKDFAEDGEFFIKAQSRFPSGGIVDADGLCLHEIHTGSSSRCFPQYRLPHLLLKKLFPEFQFA